MEFCPKAKMMLLAAVKEKVAEPYIVFENQCEESLSNMVKLTQTLLYAYNNQYLKVASKYDESKVFLAWLEQLEQEYYDGEGADIFDWFFLQYDYKYNSKEKSIEISSSFTQKLLLVIRFEKNLKFN